MHKKFPVPLFSSKDFYESRKKEGLKPDYLNMVTIAVVVPVFTSLPG